MARHKYLSSAVELIYHTQAERMNIARRRRAAFVVWMALIWSSVGAILAIQGIAIFAIRHPLHPSISNVLGFLGSVFVLPGALMFWVGVVIPSFQEVVGSGVLYAAILRGDTMFAPHDAHQPEQLSDGASVDSQSILPEYPIQVSVIERVLAIMILFMVFIMVILLVLGALELLDVLPFDPNIASFMFVCWPLGFLLGALTAQIVRYGREAFYPPLMRSLAIDDQGIRWLEVGRHTRECALAWKDIRAFCVHKQYFSQSYRTVYTYLLLGQDAHFGWIVWQSPTTPQSQASGVFGELVVTRTGLPLLDVTESSNMLNQFSRLAKQDVAGRSTRRMQTELERAIVDESQMGLISRIERELARPIYLFILRSAAIMALLTLAVIIAWVLHG